MKARLSRTHPAAVVETFDFEARVRDGLVRERLLALLAGFFGVLAVLVAVVGVYGMVSYGAAQRRREIGIRVALGARRLSVVGLVVREAMWLLAAGVVVGGVVAVVTAHSAESLLFDLRPEDPLTLGAAASLLGIVAALASYLPARRAARVSPLEALRQE